MTWRTDPLTVSLTIVTLLGCGLIGVIGIGIAVMGVIALIGGVHGGPIVAALMVFFGAAMVFLGYHLGRMFIKSEHDRISGGRGKPER